METDNQALVAKTADLIKAKLSSSEKAHDWWHVYRVWQLSKAIAVKEKAADMLVVELGALMHDIADWKFHGGDLSVAPRLAREWLDDLKVDNTTAVKVVEIVEHISYRGGTNKHVMQTLEGRIVQDADRLDAMGAIGIGRTFTFGGSRGIELYNPDIAPAKVKNFKQFQAKMENTPTINHFYEKLLLLKDTMNTPTGRTMAEHRHAYMEAFLAEFYDEWEGKR